MQTELLCKAIKQGYNAFQLHGHLPKVRFCLFVLRFYGQVNTTVVMLCQSVNLLKLFLGRLRPPKLSAHTLPVTDNCPS